jgi:hypothetical protein
MQQDQCARRHKDSEETCGCGIRRPAVEPQGQRHRLDREAERQDLEQYHHCEDRGGRVVAE